jgi:hypothetical protein
MTEKSLGRCLGLAHERPCGLRIEGARDIVEPAELEDRELVLEGRQHLVGDALRPIDGIPGDEARTLQQAVISQVDVDQNCVNAVKRRTAVEAKRQHVFLYISAGTSGGFPRIMSEAFSATMMVGALVLLDGTKGMTEASTILMPRSPRNLRSGVTTAPGPEPIAQVPAG